MYGILTFVNIAANYMTFYRESKSIYLMRRIPDRWELPRRCAAVPLIGLAAGLILTAILICLCNLIYFKADAAAVHPGGRTFSVLEGFRMIELNHISKSYGATRALDDVSLSIGPASLSACSARTARAKRRC